MWQIESEDETVGSACRWDGHYRLRHLCSGLLLALRPRPPPPPDGAPPTLREASFPNVAPKDAGVPMESWELDVCLIEGRLDGGQWDEATLWQFKPQYALEGDIYTQQFLRLRHVQEGAFVHASPPEESLSLHPTSPSSAAEKKGGIISLVARERQHEADIFAVQVRPQPSTCGFQWPLPSPGHSPCCLLAYLTPCSLERSFRRARRAFHRPCTLAALGRLSRCALTAAWHWRHPHVTNH
jgi:hypothetical protein